VASQYVRVTVELAPQTLDMLAKDAREAMHNAAVMIGIAGLEAMGTFTIEAHPFEVAALGREDVQASRGTEAS
jgi:hypothetical protein